MTSGTNPCATRTEGRPGDRLAAVLAISRAVGSTLDLDTLLQSVMSQVTGLVDADRSTLYVVDRPSGTLWSRVLQGEALREIRLGLGEGVAGWVAREGLPVVLAEAHDDPRFDPTWDHGSGYRTRSLLAVPLRNKADEVVAVVQCLNKPGGFTAEDADLLLAVSCPIAVALENAVLYQSLLDRNVALLDTQRRLAQANEELEILFDLERRAAAARDERDLLGLALERTCHHLGAPTGAILVAGAGRVLRCLRGLLSEVPHRSTTAFLQQFDTAAWIDGEALRADPSLDLIDAEIAGRVLVAPLRAHGLTVGLLQVADPTRGADDPDGVARLVAALGAQIARNVELQRSRAAEDRAQRLSILGQTVSTILHDLRTPMGAIDGYAELMAETEEPSDRLAFASRIRRALAHMEGMTREVLEFARGERELLVSTVLTNRFVDDVREIVEPALSRKAVALVVEDHYRGPARFDQARLARVVANLARNAAEAMPGGGTFAWRVDRAGDQLVMEFSDTGPGIPEALLDRLFESFASFGKKHGTGLGLAMARRVVEAHQGRIACVTSSPSGTTFRIEIPVDGPA